MAYDPFAPVPVVVPPVAAPVPTTDPNNALAPVVTGQPAPVSTPVSVTAAPGAGGALPPGQGGPHPLSFVDHTGRIADFQGFLAALQTWRSGRPQFSYDTTSDESLPQQRADFRSARSDWRSQRPTFRDYLGMGSGAASPPVATTPLAPPPVTAPPVSAPPVMMPGGGDTGAPLQPSPGTVGMVPGVPGSVATNPGTRTGVPGFPGMPNLADWRGPRSRIG